MNPLGFLYNFYKDALKLYAWQLSVKILEGLFKTHSVVNIPSLLFHEADLELYFLQIVLFRFECDIFDLHLSTVAVSVIQKKSNYCNVKRNYILFKCFIVVASKNTVVNVIFGSSHRLLEFVLPWLKKEKKKTLN